MKFLKNVSLTELQCAAAETSQAYRHQDSSQALLSMTHILGYVATRMPATQGVLESVFTKLPADNIKTMIDLGSGPGTALLAAKNILPKLESALAIEKNINMITAAQQLWRDNIYEHKTQCCLTIEWQQQDLTTLTTLPITDVVVISYALNEIKQSHYTKILALAFASAQRYIVIIEPGSHRGFDIIKTVRSYLIEQGGYVIAPCTHSQDCPITGQDWCHFSERIRRSTEHRQVKKASLSHEDEKYSYVIISKNKPLDHKGARIIKQPLKRHGHVRLDLCESSDITQKIITRKDNVAYKHARRSEWGDLWIDDK